MCFAFIGFACSTKEEREFEKNSAFTDIIDLEFNDKVGIQSQIYADYNAVVSKN